VRATVHDIHAALAGDLPERRDALRVLLSLERLRVFADPERGFRVEGLLRVLLMEPAREGAGPVLKLVAGGR
jgi:hypothetical protein